MKVIITKPYGWYENLVGRVVEIEYQTNLKFIVNTIQQQKLADEMGIKNIGVWFVRKDNCEVVV